MGMLGFGWSQVAHLGIGVAYFNTFSGTCHLKGTIMNNMSILFSGTCHLKGTIMNKISILFSGTCHLKGTIMNKMSILFSPRLLQIPVMQRHRFCVRR